MAKEFVKIVKNLVAGQNIADKPGEYKNFTGTINYPTVKARVKDANFKLSGQFFDFYDGIWINGKITVTSTTWYNGTWESSRFVVHQIIRCYNNWDADIRANSRLGRCDGASPLTVSEYVD